MAQGQGWRRDFPYYKVQVFSDRLLAWIDEKRAFSTVQDATRHISNRLFGRRCRIIVVEKKGRRPLDENAA